MGGRMLTCNSWMRQLPIRQQNQVEEHECNSPHRECERTAIDYDIPYSMGWLPYLLKHGIFLECFEIGMGSRDSTLREELEYSWIRERIEISTDESWTLMGFDTMSLWHLQSITLIIGTEKSNQSLITYILDEFPQFMGEHHTLDQLDITEFGIPMDMSSADNERRPDYIVRRGHWSSWERRRRVVHSHTPWGRELVDNCYCSRFGRKGNWLMTDRLLYTASLILRTAQRAMLSRGITLQTILHYSLRFTHFISLFPDPSVLHFKTVLHSFLLNFLVCTIKEIGKTLQ